MSIDKHILVDQWRPERPKRTSVRSMVRDLVDRHGITTVVARLGVTDATVRRWLKRGDVELNNREVRAAIMRWWGEDDEPVEDALVYSVQAFRQIQQKALIEGETVSINELVQRLNTQGEMAQRALDFLAKRIGIR